MSENIKLESLLNDPSLVAKKAYVAGEWINAQNGKTFDVINPATGEIIASLPDLDVSDAKHAIDAAALAQKKWAQYTGKERAAILREMYNLMTLHANDLGIILTAEMGKPLAEGTGEIAYAASFFEWFGEEAKRIYGETIPGHMRDKRITVLKEPIGVVTSITPWNFPSAMITRKLAPALAAGCSFVGRPATETPLSALAIAIIAERAGLPKGLLSILTSSKSHEIGLEFCTNNKVRKLTFTGSTQVGRILMRQCSDQIMKLSLELGGNAPFIVFDDANLDDAVDGAIISKFRNNGQTCVCANRIYVQAGVYDAFAKKIIDRVKLMTVGNGMVPGIINGPLIDMAAVEKVEEHIADAVTKGATIETGGSRHELGGTFFEPTVITGAKSNMLMTEEETFGPLAPLFKFENEEDVIAAANDTIYGLACYFYANDLSRVTRVQESLEYGIVGVNTGIISTEVAPFGGVKQSGLGREGSHHGIQDFLEMKYICTSVK